MPKLYDLIIAGLGPAGSTAAYYAARNGLSVLALEKQAFPRIKPCGGGITAKGLKVIDIDWSGLIQHQASSIRISSGKESIQFSPDNPLIYMVSRSLFDDYLAQQAKSAGADLRFQEPLKEIIETGDLVTVRTAQGEYQGKYLLGADGSLGLVRKHVIGTHIRNRLYVAVESDIPLRQIPDFKLSEEIVFDLGYPRMGYGWVFQKGDYISIGIYGPANSKPNPVEWFWRYLENYGIRLKKEAVHYRSYPCTVFETPRDPVGQNRILLVGDAANFIDPLLGEGIYYALRSGRLVGEQVLSPGTNQLSPQEVQSQYQALLQSTLFPELVASRGLADLIYRFPQLSFKLFKREPELFYSFCRVLSAEQGFAQFSKHAKDVLLRRHPLMTQLLLTMRRFMS